MTIRNICFLVFLTINWQPIAHAEGKNAIIDGKFAEYLIEVEGIRSLEVNGAVVTKTIDSIVQTSGANPSYADLLSTWSNAPETEESEVVLALGLFSAGISGDVEAAFELVRQNNDRFEQTDLSYKVTNENMAGDAYGWLVDNVNFVVPKSLAVKAPQMINDDTPFWGGTRDGYFSIEGSRDWPVFNSEEQDVWLRALDDIESPDKEIWRGSIRNTDYKAIEIFRGLIVHNPTYVLEHIEDYKDADINVQWLNYWRYSGAYEYATHKIYIEEREKFSRLLEQYLLNKLNGQFESASKLTKLYIGFVERRFTGNDNLSKTAQRIAQSLKTSTWEKVIEDENLSPSSNRYIVGMIGGMLLERDEKDFIRYANWLKQESREDIVGDLIGLAALSHKLTPTLVSAIETPTFWGTFNKTPLMYAAHFDDIGAYRNVLALYPEQYTMTTINGEEYGSLPKIGKRNVLMYALENSRLSFLNEILNEKWIKDLNSTDTANRGFGDYLDLNEYLNEKEKEDIYGELTRMGVLIRPLNTIEITE